MKKKISLPVIVEGKYDKITLTSIFDCTVITTGGFSIFNSNEKKTLFKRIAENGIIVLVDSDGGGKQIRSYLASLLPKEKVHNLYIPKIEGKEKRKKAPGKAGILGVEGMSKEILERLFKPFTTDQKLDTGMGKAVTKLDFYEDGLSGGVTSAHKRRELCKMMDLPDDMTANALLEAVNLLYSYEEYKEFLKKLLF